MITFKYKARKENGELIKGDLTAKDQQEVKRVLDNKGYFIISLTEKSSLLSLLKFKKAKMNLKQLALFARQLGVILNSGMTLVIGLSTLAKQTESDELTESFNQIKLKVKEGLSFSEALSEQDAFFPKFFINMVAIGEEGGALAEILKDLAKYYKQEDEKKRQLIAAMTYPSIIFVVAIAIVLFLILGVLPAFIDTFTRLDVELPVVTRLLLGLSNFIFSYWIGILLAILALLLAAKLIYQTEQGRYYGDLIIFKLPLLKSFIINSAVVKFSNNLKLLYASGVPILQGLDIVKITLSNQVIVRKIEEAYKEVKNGNSLTEALVKQDVFPEVALQMIKTGEETGQLEIMLSKVGQFYQAETKEEFEKLVTFIEPTMIVVLGFVVGFIVVSIVMPMFDIMQIIR